MCADRNQYLRGLLCFWAATCLCLWPGIRTEAAGAGVAIETESATVVKGDYFYIVVTVTSADQIGGFEGYFSYDQHVMKYITGGSVSSGNDDVFTISDTERESAASKIKYSIRFLARKTGDCVVELRKPYGVYDGDGVKMSVASDSLAIRVISKKRARKLGILPGEEGTAEKGDVEASGGDDTGDHADGEETEDGMKPSAEPLPGETGIPVTDAASSGEEQSPEQSSDSFPAEDIPLGDGLNGKEDPEGLVEPAGEAKRSVKKVSGPGKTACIIVISLSCLGLAGILCYMVRDGKKEYDVETGEPEEDSVWDIEDRMYPAGREGPGGAEGNNYQKPEESLEEIERRLEQKRQWLRKGN